MKKFIRINLLATIALINLVCLPAYGADEDRGRVKVLMHTFLMELEKMSPYISSEKALNSPKAREIVGSSLKVLEAKVKNPPPMLKESPGFRISFSMLADHIKKTKQAFDQGEFEHTRLRLNGTTALCAGCHTQTPKISKLSPFSSLEERFQNSTFENATFLFVIRRFPEALAMFDELVRNYPKSVLNSDQLGELYRRKLTIFARVLRDPQAAIDNLNADLKNDKLPTDIRANVKEWITSLEKWKAEKSNPAEMSTRDLLAYVAKALPAQMNRKVAPSDPQLLSILRLSGLLYERLFAEPNSPNAQEILYDLAMCERALAPLYFYSVSEIYLKECIVRYPKQAFSKKCFEAYRDGMTERYFGKPIPKGVEASIEALRKYL
jgi:tetratricopeptide (TPR) repeat protein